MQAHHFVTSLREVEMGPAASRTAWPDLGAAFAVEAEKFEFGFIEDPLKQQTDRLNALGDEMMARGAQIFPFHKCYFEFVLGRRAVALVDLTDGAEFIDDESGALVIARAARIRLFVEVARQAWTPWPVASDCRMRWNGEGKAWLEAYAGASPLAVDSEDWRLAENALDVVLSCALICHVTEAGRMPSRCRTLPRRVARDYGLPSYGYRIVDVVAARRKLDGRVWPLAPRRSPRWHTVRHYKYTRHSTGQVIFVPDHSHGDRTRGIVQHDYTAVPPDQRPAEH